MIPVFPAAQDPVASENDRSWTGLQKWGADWFRDVPGELLEKPIMRIVAFVNKGCVLDRLPVLLFPFLELCSLEWLRVVNVDLQRESGLSLFPVEFGVRAVIAGENQHDRPVAAPEAASKGGPIHGTGTGTVAGMRMNPDSPELFWSTSQIHLILEELGHGGVVELHRDRRAGLFDQLKFLDPQQVVRRSDSKGPHFGRSQVTEKPQLRPGGGAERQCRFAKPFLSGAAELSA